MFKLVLLCAAVAMASAGYLEPAISSYGYSTSTVLKAPIVAPIAHVAPIAYHTPVVYKAPVATSYQSFTKIDKPAIHYAPVHYAAPIIKTYTPHYAYAAAPLAYSSPYAYGHHSHYYR